MYKNQVLFVMVVVALLASQSMAVRLDKMRLFETPPAPATSKGGASSAAAAASGKKLEPQYIGEAQSTSCGESPCHTTPEYKDEQTTSGANCRDGDLGCPVRAEAEDRHGPTVASPCGCSTCPCSNDGPFPLHTTTDDVKTRLPIIPAYDGEDGIESSSSDEETTTSETSEETTTDGGEGSPVSKSLKEVAKEIAEEGLQQASKELNEE